MQRIRAMSPTWSYMCPGVPCRPLAWQWRRYGSGCAAESHACLTASMNSGITPPPGWRALVWQLLAAARVVRPNGYVRPLSTDVASHWVGADEQRASVRFDTSWVATPPGRVGMPKCPMVVPDWAHIAWVGLEQELRCCVDAPCRVTTHWARTRLAGLTQLPFDIEMHLAGDAFVLIAWHRRRLPSSSFVAATVQDSRGTCCTVALAWQTPYDLITEIQSQ